MGLDSKAGTHWGFGRDVAGFSLSYFKDDYIPIGNSKFIASIGASGGFGNSSPSLYNGNIRRATYALENLTDETLGYSYQYDQLNRLTGMDVWTNFNASSYSWPNGGSASTKWKERVSYDANGNIQTYNRNGNSPIGMDSLTYNYYANTNQLKRVDDIVGSSNYSVDIDDQSGTNYKYDEIGNLARDASEEIDTILWTLTGKVDSISRTSASTKDELKFLYDPMGNRVAKIVTKDNNEVITTWYARDPQGNILAVYTQSHDTLWFDEAHIYGSSRLGYWKPDKILYDPVTGCKCDSESLDSIQGIHITTNKFRGDNCYEITNHLGNVLAVISDKKIAIDDDSDGLIDYFTADILNIQDYYPFGMLMPSRTWSAGSEYRFGFNGQLKTDEISGKGNHYSAEFWEYNPRVVIRWNTDPILKEWESPYAINKGNPIWFQDSKGNNPSTHTDEDGNVIAVKDDGDLGVYKHDGMGNGAKKNFDQNYSFKNTSAGGTKMGETFTPLGFADFDAYEKDGSVKPGLGAKIDFTSNWATNQVSGILNQNPSIIEYGWNARSGHDWDIKTKAPGGNPYYGSKLYGKYASARDAGNFTAGAVAQKSIVPNIILDYGFGTYNISGNSVGKSFLMIATDVINITFSPVEGTGIILDKVNGEDKLSRMGIEAGKSYFKK
ncbi:MAG: hypothetical protein IPH61_16335 [Bacteroidetes bacterium]|nr:hypothetical protein [Bacteroidota bacterium]